MAASTIACRRHRIAVGAIASGVVFLAAPVVEAAPTSKLTYVRGPGAETCPDEGELRSAVARRVGYDPFFPYADRTVVAQIDHKGAGFTALVRIVDSAGHLLGERSIAAMSSCGELVQNLALTISVAIDDLDAASGAPPEAEPARAAPPEPPPTLEAPATDKSERPPLVAATPPASKVHLHALVGAVGSLGAAPAPAIGIAPAVALRGEWWQLGVEGRFDAPAASDVGGGGAVSTMLGVGAVTPCVLSPGTITPYGCVELMLGSFRGASQEVTTPASASALYGALGARVGAELALAPRLGAYLQLDLAAPTARHRLELSGATVYTIPAVWVAAGLGISLVVF